jgi:GNAT superfamily N-acetyltransferase
MIVRDAEAEDWPAIWPFFRQIVRAGDTFPYDEEMDEERARATWLPAPPWRTGVAVADEETILGSSIMGPNYGGPGSHIANASYMVDPVHRGKGVGRALCEDSIEWARERGFRAVQFNAVAATNAGAIELYRSLGFEILTTIPEGFHHPTEGYVGLHLMHRRL